MRASSMVGSFASILMAEAGAIFTSLIKPSLVAIYVSHKTKPENPVQVGTGFLIARCSRPVLITAKHTLRGENLKEDPGDKAVHVDGSWVYIGDGKRTIVEPKDRDLAVAYMDEFRLDQCLALSHLSSQVQSPKIVTIGGFIARDFRRRGNTLLPAPYIYSSVGVVVDAGLVGLRYPKRRNVDTKTSKAGVTSRPSGLSGCPMVDTIKLIKGTVSVVGVFTDQKNGKAWGEDANILQTALASL